MRARNRISPLQVEVSWDGVVATVTAAGEVDLASATSLAGRLRSVAATHPERLVLDLRGLVFADMAAARTLEAVHQALGAECPVIVRKPRLAAREAFGLPRPAGGPDGRRVPVPDTSYPLRMAGGVPVVTTPAEIDPASAGSLRALACTNPAWVNAAPGSAVLGTRASAALK